MSGLPPNATRAEIEDEIIFNRLLIDTLDRDSDAYEADKLRLDKTIEELENMLSSTADSQDQNTSVHPAFLSAGNNETLNGGSNGFAQPHASASAQKQKGTLMPGSWAFSDLPSASSSRGVVNPLQDYRRTSNASSPSSESTHDSASTSPFGALPASRKRPRGPSHPDIRAPSASIKRRPTPSPADTNPSTPGSVDSLDLAEKGFEQQHGNIFNKSSDAAIQRAIERQKAAERMAQERVAQRQRDAELALSLQSGGDQRPPASQNRDQALLTRDGNFRRPPRPQVSSSASLSSAVPSGASQAAKREKGQPVSIDSLSNPAFGATSSYTLPSMPLEQELDGAHTWGFNGDIGAANDSNSDIEEISPDIFLSSIRSDPQASSHSASLGQNAITHNYGGLSGPSSSVKQDPFASLDNFYTGVQDSSAPFAYGQYAPVTNNNGYAQSLYSQCTQPLVNAVRNGTQVFSDVLHGMNGFGMSPYDGITLPTLPPIPGDPDFSANMPGLGHGVYGSRSDDPFRHIFDGSEDDHNGYAARWSRHDYLYSDPTKTKEEINKLLENIRPDEDLPAELRGGTPEAMRTTLMEHQKVGLTWMKKMEEGSNKGGILADDMGLGKTIQALALIVSRPSKNPRRKTNLIIAPVALMRQWKHEIENKVKGGEHRLNVFIQHGQNKKNCFNALRHYDVVLTTFGTLGSEVKRKEEWLKLKAANPDAVPTGRFKLALIGEDCLWYRVIIDEAQCIKNKATQTAKAAHFLEAEYRWCMTGTPMMNNVGELYSLIHFLRIKPYNQQQRFNLDITNALRSNHARAKEAGMRKLQALLKAILLRRTKKSTIDGQPIITLPPRITEVEHVVFSEDEDEFYRALEKKTTLQFNKYLKAGTVGKNYSNVLVLLLRLRQACCHPHLIKNHCEEPPGNLSNEVMEALASKLTEGVVARIKAFNGSFECPVCYDAVENPAIFIPCGHDTCSECFSKITDPARAIAEGHGDGADARCPECRGRVDPKKIIDFNTFKKVHQPELLTDEDRAKVTEAEETSSETESEDDDDSEDETVSLDGFIVNDDDDVTESEDDGSAEEVAVKKKKPKKAKKDRKGKAKARDAKPHKSLAELKKEGMRNAAAKRKYLRRLRKDWVTSAKIEKTLALLRDINANDPREKTIIFSQFTSLLDLLEIPVDSEGWGYRRYDGSMSATMRADAVADFMERPSCKVMLVSLKAGNAGLNLTAASQVIILDPFWNPYIEEQAIDRAHRIGQKREVRIHRILVGNTVEDRIIALQEKKRELISTALDENAGKSIARLGVQELAYLFGVTANPTQRVPTA